MGGGAALVQREVGLGRRVSVVVEHAPLLRAVGFVGDLVTLVAAPGDLEGPDSSRHELSEMLALVRANANSLRRADLYRMGAIIEALHDSRPVPEDLDDPSVGVRLRGRSEEQPQPPVDWHAESLGAGTLLLRNDPARWLTAPLPSPKLKTREWPSRSRHGSIGLPDGAGRGRVWSSARISHSRASTNESGPERQVTRPALVDRTAVAESVPLTEVSSIASARMATTTDSPPLPRIVIGR